MPESKTFHKSPLRVLAKLSNKNYCDCNSLYMATVTVTPSAVKKKKFRDMSFRHAIYEHLHYEVRNKAAEGGFRLRVRH